VNDRRRAVLGLAALAALPLRAAEPVKRVAYLALDEGKEDMAAALARLGWIEGRNLVIDHRSLSGSEAAAGLAVAARAVVALKPDVAITMTGRPTQALIDADPRMPIVTVLFDPVGEGFAREIAKPGGHVTGLSMGGGGAITFLMDALGRLRPGMTVIHSIALPAFHREATVKRMRERMHRERGFEFIEHACTSPAEALAALQSVRDTRREVVVLGGVPGMDESLLAEFSRQAVRAGIIVLGGGVYKGTLMSATLTHADAPGQVASLADKILRGADPATLPFQEPTVLEFHLNLGTARALGLEIPKDLQLRATKIYG
jgi:putative ABC transport system substrate-binding protein